MNLTARSYTIVIAITALGILGEWGGPAYEYAWRMPAAIFILLILLERFNAQRIVPPIIRELDKQSRLGRPLTMTFSMSNIDQRPLNVQILDTHPLGILQSAEPIDLKASINQTSSTSITITPTLLGTLQWQDVQARILGRFGLARWSRSLSIPGELKVVPDRLNQSEHRKAATQVQGDIIRRQVGSGMELMGLREYQAGDPLHYIDWKATARSSNPIVRVYTEEQHLELVLLIDIGRTSAMQAGTLTRLGHYCNIAARLAEKAISNGDQIHVIVFSDQVQARLKRLKGPAGLRRVRNLLQELHSMPNESNPLPAIMQVRNLVQQRSLVVMLTDLDDGDAATQLVQSVSLLRPKHLPLIASPIDSEVTEIQHRYPAQWLDPYQSLAANETALNWHRTRLRLERLGVPVVLSPVQHLDSRVLASYDMMKQQHRI